MDLWKMCKEIKILENKNILNKCKKYINYTNVLENYKFCKDSNSI